MSSFLGRAMETIFLPQGSGSLFMRGTHSGKNVSVASAMGFAPVYSAVSQIAGAIGTLPAIVYKRDGGGRLRALDHRGWPLLHDEPNPEMAADEFYELTASHIELWGNAFIWKKRDSLGIVRELWPLSPRRVGVTRDANGARIFGVDGQPFGEDTILHIRGLSPDGLVGYSPIQLQRNAIANGMSMEEFQGKFVGQGGKPSVVLTHPNKLEGDAAARLKASWDNLRDGGTAVLEEGTSVERLTMSLVDSQFVDQMKYSDLRIAQIFQLPPGRLGAPTGDPMTYSTTEMEGLNFVTYTLQRRLKRIESAINRDPSIFTSRDYFVEFLVDALMRTDIRTRTQAYMLALKGGWMTKEEVRERENLPPLPPSDDPEPPPVPTPGGDDE
jgi:HK97 family phage portal protein